MAAKVLDGWALIAFFEGESAADAVGACAATGGRWTASTVHECPNPLALEASRNNISIPT